MAKNYKVYEEDLELSFRDDPRNANAGTERGHKMLERSVEEFGAARSMVVDADGYVVAGNKTREALIAAGIKNAVVVETDGTTPVIVKRKDWSLDGENSKAREYAYADNRVGQIDLSWNGDVIAADMESGIKLDWMFSDGELTSLTLPMEEGETDAKAEWEGMPGFEQEDAMGVRRLIVHFKTNADVEDFERIVGQTLSPKTKYIWHPKAEIEYFSDKTYVPDGE